MTLKHMMSDYIAKHCTGRIKKTTSRLTAAQNELEQRVTKSIQSLRNRQLTMSQCHSSRQLESNQLDINSPLELHDHRVSNEATPLLTSPTTTSSQSSVDNSPTCIPDSTSHRKASLSSFGIQKHLQSLGSLVDEDATCSSSDEEEDAEMSLCRRKKQLKHSKLHSVKRSWEKDRAHIGSKWAWLCHQITSINQKIYQLDTLLQSSQPLETVQLDPHNPFGTPCICGTKNGEVGMTTTVNGQYSHQSKSGKTPSVINRPCTCQIRQLIVNNPALMSQQLQVKDLLECGLPALLMEESTQTCARTRHPRHIPRRRLLRSKRNKRLTDEPESEQVIDSAYHPFLSQLTDLSSSLWMDKAVHQILQEHSYASFPLQKRRKLSSASIIDQALSCIPVALRLERSKSFSPSPTPLDMSIERIGRGIPRKRHSTNTHSFSDDSNHVTTPTLPRKRKSTNTPQYDIDNIIIPYSMASSTRLEKLEYKEIITPKWQEKLYSGSHKNGITENDEEDISDATFKIRHAKCEEKEKKRYMNFIGGNGTNGRRRQHLKRSSTPEVSNHVSSFVNSDHDGDMHLQILPYPPRKFPLIQKELHALEKPAPPPKKIIKYVPIASSSSSPSPLQYSDKNHHVSTPHEDNVSPLSISPFTRDAPNESPLSKWTVVNGNSDSQLVLKLSKFV